MVLTPCVTLFQGEWFGVFVVGDVSLDGRRSIVAVVLRRGAL